MNNEFFNDMQSLWMKNFGMKNFATNDWMENMQEQNVHFCNPACSNMTEHMSNMTKVNAKFAQDSLTLGLENLKSNLSAKDMEQMVYNNQKFMQQVAFNSANYAKQLLAHSANAGIELYEHISDTMMENFNIYNSSQKEYKMKESFKETKSAAKKQSS